MRERRMQHLDEGTIHAWLDGALSVDEAAKVEAHVAECAQCAAAVAEARGFIAGASRILTALDSVPSGVVPVAEVQKRTNWPVWRAAAAIVVVALGSLVVLKERNGDSATSASDTVSTVTTPASAGALVGSTSSSEASGQERMRQVVPPPVAKAAPAEAPLARSSSASDQQQNPTRNGQAKAPSPSFAPQNASRPGAVGAPNRGEAEQFSRAAPSGGSIAAMDAAATPFPKLIGPRREIGRNTTLYEVSPGDTVALSEDIETRLDGVVVTGAQLSVQTTAAGATRRAAGSTAPQTQSSASAKASAVQSPPAASAPAIAPTPAPAAIGGIANQYNTITWTDSASGKKMTLSGHHSTAELEQIRQTIEQVRARQAAEKKKQP
jgi:hypothetical protein